MFAQLRHETEFCPRGGMLVRPNHDTYTVEWCQEFECPFGRATCWWVASSPLTKARFAEATEVLPPVHSH